MRLDRLATLLSRLTVEAAGSAVPDATLTLCAEGAAFRIAGGDVPGAPLFAARLRWGAAAQGLWDGAPAIVTAPGTALHALAGLAAAEAAAPRCGAEALLRGYAEALVVHRLRLAIEHGAGQGGLLAGLADPRLARALTALHDAPARTWRAEDMAAEAGMSRSAFMRAFAATLGEPPASYLRRFRLDRARADLAAGARVAEVARRYGYRSSDAFTRAFRRAEGYAPARSAARGGPPSEPA